MKIHQKSKNDVEIFEVQGDIDFHSSSELRGRLLKALDQPSRKILVNLKRVNYIDSSGLATFVEALQKTKRNNNRLVLVELGKSVRSVFEIAKLDAVFWLASSEEEAFTLLGD